LSKNNSVSHWSEITFLPISFFKTHEVVSARNEATLVFKSSGTHGNRSQHFLTDVSIYEKSFQKSFEIFYGKPQDYCILALLPNYLSQGNSSLVYMVNHLIKQAIPGSGFFLNELNNLSEQITFNEKNKISTLLIGVSYALLDFAYSHPTKLNHTLVIETGGMKGTRKEITKAELHKILSHNFGLPHIHSEYGMTELLSQAYSSSNGVFQSPPWMKILTRDITDPFTLLEPEKRGGINIIDLANQNSCSFIETQDLGVCHQNGSFEILGRIDLADIRGCNLLVADS
jgi:phenylacetate-coenzyme A ligase PaaK-like adenylate-forming protein